MISSHKKAKDSILKKKELPKKLKETVAPLKRDQIDLRRVKYFLKHVVTAHVRISKRNKAREDLKEHLEKLRDVPGISKTARVEEALQELEDKMHNALQKEKELMTEHRMETVKVRSLTKEAEYLRRRIKELEKKAIKQSGLERPKKRIKDIRDVLRMEKQIKKLEKIHKKFKKVKKHQKETKVIESKLKVLRERLKKAKS